MAAPIPSSSKRKSCQDVEEPEAKCLRPRRISAASLSSSSARQIISSKAQNDSRSLKQMLKAIASNKINKLMEILKSSKDTDKLTIDELNQALYHAAANANYFMTLQLIQNGANMNFKDRNEKNCLHVAAEKGYLDITKLLVLSKFNIDGVDCDGNTALILCQSSKAASHTTKLLVDAHAQPNIQNKAGETALMEALRNQNVQAMMFLLERASYTLKDINGNTAESLAADMGFGGLMRTLAEGIYEEKYMKEKRYLARAILQRNIPQLELLISSKLFNVNDYFRFWNDRNVIIHTNLGLFFTRCWKKRETPLTRAQKKEYLPKGINVKLEFSATEMQMMSILLKAGASIHMGTEYGIDGIRTPILMAIQIGDHGLLNFLLKNEGSPNFMNFNSYCKALDVAALKGRHDLIALIAPKVQYLSTSVESVEDDKNKCLITVALHSALSCGFKKCVDELLPLISNLDYSQAVSVAAGSGHYSIYCKMKDYRPQLFTKLVIKDDGFRWLSEACRNDCPEQLKDSCDIVTSLLRSGAKPNDQNSGDLMQPLNVCNSAKVTKLLLQFGAKLEKAKRGYYFYNGEECAMANAVRLKSPEMVKVLINYGATVDINLLTIVLRRREYQGEMRKLILSCRIDFDQADLLGKTAIFHAVINSDFESVVTLVKNGADVNLTSDKSPPPLIFAAVNDNIEVMSFLLANGANVDIKNKKGETALTLSTTEACITLLSSKGANLNVFNNDGHSALMLSARRNNFQVFCALIAAGADVNIRNNGHTLLSHLLKDFSYHEEQFIVYLLDHGGKVSARNSMYAVHNCIQLRNYRLLSAFISSGQFCPSVLNVSTPECRMQERLLKQFHGVLSPLCMALICNDVTLARVLLQINFLTTSDFTILPGSKEVLNYLRLNYQNECIGFLENMLHGPPSLMQLTHTKVSNLIRPDPDRSSRITKLGLPSVLEKSLSFTLNYQRIIETDFHLEGYYEFESEPVYDTDDCESHCG